MLPLIKYFVPRIRYEKVEVFYGEDSAPHTGLDKQTNKQKTKNKTQKTEGEPYQLNLMEPLG